MRYFVFLLFPVLIISGIAAASLAEPISGKVLFANREFKTLELSPGSQFLSVIYGNEKMNRLALIDTVSLDVHYLMDFSKKNVAYISDVLWVNDSTLYVNSELKFGGSKHGFIYLSKKGEELGAKYKRIQLRGKVLVPERLQGEKIIFIQEKNKKPSKYNVYEVTPEQLINNNYNKNSAFAHPYKNASAYLTDDSGDIRFCVAVEGDSVIVLLLNEDDKWVKFQEISEVGDFESLHVPVGIINKDKIAVLSNQQSDKTALYEYDLSRNALGKVLYEHETYDLTDAGIDHSSGGIKYVTYFDHGRPTTRYFSKNDQRVKSLLKKAFKNKQIAIMSERVDGPIKVILVHAGDDPGSYYLFNEETLIADMIELAFPKLHEKVLNKTESFDVPAEDGYNVEAILTRPNKPNNVLLVMPHGGPVGVRDTATFNPINQYFASRGYTVLNVNFRGSTGFGKEFLAKGRGQFGQKIEDDISRAVTHALSKHKYTKVCSIGNSYGGYSAMMLAINRPQTYDCVITMFGVFDLPLLFNASNFMALDFYRDAIAKVVGDFDNSLYEYSPVYKVNDFHKPTLLIAGKKDKVAHFEQSNRMKYRLNQLGIDHETVFYENAGHGHSYWNGDQHQYAYVDDFLRRKLNLPHLDAKRYSEIVVEEALILADSFAFDGFVENNSLHAQRLYKQASDAGNGRAMFNYGGYFHRGENVEKNIKTAMTWYEKSFKAGYLGAGLRLGDLYIENEELSDPVSGLNYYIQAGEKGSSKAYVAAAKLLIEGEAINRDVSRAVELLGKVDREKVKDQYVDLLVNAIWLDDFTTDEFAIFETYINATANTVVPKDWGFALKVFDANNSRSSARKIKSRFSVSDWNIKYHFGKPSPSIEGEWLVKGVWIYLEDQVDQPYRHRFYHYISSKYGDYNGSLDDAHYEDRPGRWVFELRSLSNTLLIRHEFTVES